MGAIITVFLVILLAVLFWALRGNRDTTIVHIGIVNDESEKK